MAEQPQVLYGGQAVIEGVMIRGREDAVVAVRTPDGEIAIRPLPRSGWWLPAWRRFVFLRGIAALAETLGLGMKSLAISANLAATTPDQEADAERAEALGNVAIAVMLALSLGLAIVIFFLVPVFLSRGLETFGWSAVEANIGEGLLRVALFVGYLVLIGRMEDIRRLYGYHGAEHMAVHARENGAPLTIEGLRRYPTAHPRCGTAFLLTVVLVSILAFMFFPRDPLWLHAVSRLALVPVVASASYEIIRFFGRHPANIWVRVLGSPSLLLQDLTTSQPDDGQCEVAIAAITAAVARDTGEPLKAAAPKAAGAGAGPGDQA